MTPKEKAKELYLKFHFAIPAIADEGQPGQNSAKECALIAVDEIISVLNPEHWGIEMNIAIDELIYWKEIEQEIEIL